MFVPEVARALSRVPSGGTTEFRGALAETRAEVVWQPKKSRIPGAAWRWSGATLASLVRGLDPEGRFRGVRISSGFYSFAFRREDLSDGSPILAVELDGRPIPSEAGGPVRLIVPAGKAHECVRAVRKISLCRHPGLATARLLCGGKHLLGRVWPWGHR